MPVALIGACRLPWSQARYCVQKELELDAPLGDAVIPRGTNRTPVATILANRTLERGIAPLV
jgi:hypothetical protein